MKIKTVYLFTNRNCQFFDESGEQVILEDVNISYESYDSFSTKAEGIKDLVDQFIEDAPEFYIVRYHSDRKTFLHQITMFEWCALIGIGSYYIMATSE